MYTHAGHFDECGADTRHFERVILFSSAPSGFRCEGASAPELTCLIPTCPIPMPHPHLPVPPYGGHFDGCASNPCHFERVILFSSAPSGFRCEGASAPELTCLISEKLAVYKTWSRDVVVFTRVFF